MDIVRRLHLLIRNRFDGNRAMVKRRESISSASRLERAARAGAGAAEEGEGAADNPVNNPAS
ncbi:MAG: hypothetical protein ACKV2V_22610 [Blastocatellia bacterium]